MNQVKDNSFWLTFRLDDMDCCILSDYIQSIDIPSTIKPLPDSPKTITGITKHGEILIPVVEMRAVYNRLDLKSYLDRFAEMKAMHVTWIEDLERYVREGGTFTKSVDPHRCQFGIWYDTFQTDNDRLKRLLKKIETPHARIHHCGKEIIQLKNGGGDNQQEIEELLAEAAEICEDDMIPYLDRLISIYQSANRGVLLVVSHGARTVGLLVDEVRTLIPSDKATPQDITSDLTESRGLRRLIAYGEQMFMEVDVEQLLSMGDKMSGS